MIDILIILAVNAVLAGLLYLLYRFWLRRRPVTASKLPSSIRVAAERKADRTPCEGVLAPCIVLAQAAGLGGNPEQVWVTLLTRWVASGAIAIDRAPKRALHGFGAPVQLQLRCTQANGITGAELQLYQRFASHPDAKQGLQESLLYLWARDNAHALTNDLAQLTTEGKGYLRAHGMSKLEEKAPWFGFAQARELYTPRGVREAVLYRDYLNMPCARDMEAWLLAQPTPPQTPIGTITQQIWQGMQVGSAR